MLSEKVVVVSGGAGLIGKGLCKVISDAKARVIVADINEESAKKISNEIGGLASAISMDITSTDSIQSAIDKLTDQYGKIDGLINCAYPKTASYGRDFLEVTYEDFNKSLSMHLGGYFLTSQLFGKYFKENDGGNIISFASIYGVVAPRFQIYDNTSMTTPVEYAAIKSAIIHLTKYMARYFRGSNIRVNCISPGGIWDNQPQSFCEAYKEFCSNTGMLNYEDINGTTLFLLSDMSRQITGQNIIVDDGFSL